MQLISWISVTVGLFMATTVYSDLLPLGKCTSGILGATLLNTICTVAENDPIYAAESNGCDAHCRCAHNTSWGRCEPRPDNAPVLLPPFQQTMKMWCKCYTDPSTRPCLPAINPVACFVQNRFVDALCADANDALQLHLCDADCYCTHGNARGVCTTDKDVRMCQCYD